MADHAEQEVEAIGEAGAERAISAAVVAEVVYGLGLEDLAVAEAEVLGLALMLLTLLPKRTHAALQGWSSPHTDGTGMTLSHTLRTQATGRTRCCKKVVWGEEVKRRVSRTCTPVLLWRSRRR